MADSQEPDFFTSMLGLLETLSTPTSDKTKEAPMTTEPTVDMEPLATLSWKMYTAFADAGFTQKQAFDFVVEFVKHMIPAPSTND